MKSKIVVLAAIATLACGLLASACGSTDHEAHAQSLYNAYRTAEDSRTDAEEELRLAFRDIANAAQAQNPDEVLEAAQRGQDAVDQITDLFTAELEAAQGLEEIDSVSAHAKQLSDGLRLSRSSLALVGEELAIALDDPLLETRKTAIDGLAKESAQLAVKGELAIRRADHALALALDVRPRLDQMFTTTTG